MIKNSLAFSRVKHTKVAEFNYLLEIKLILLSIVN